MPYTLQLASPDYELSAAERELIAKEANKLSEFVPRLIACRVTVAIPNRRPQGEPIGYNVRIVLEVPGADLDVDRSGDPSLRTALQQAFKAARRRVKDYASRYDETRAPQVTGARGHVKQIFPWEGYGFLEAEDGREIYFDRKAVLDDGFDRLETGTEVRYTDTAGDKGPQASTVFVAGGHRGV